MKQALIIGGGPAGLTAAHELLEQTDILPLVIEAEPRLGGLSATIDHHGNGLDIGGHRFFSKSDWVMNWWQRIMPIGEAEASKEGVLLVRRRLSRILFQRRLFAYPLKLTTDTLRKLGIGSLARMGLSYLYARLRPVTPEDNLEAFFINRFGQRLYRTFFKAYTEKVWGVPCTGISSEWGAQRIKGLSLGKSLMHRLRRPRSRSLAQKGVETSLIERFLYPRRGPGQLWEQVGQGVEAAGGRILREHRVTAIEPLADGRFRVRICDHRNAVTELDADYLLSSMPVKELVAALNDPMPDAVRRIAAGLCYRDFVTVGVLLEPGPEGLRFDLSAMEDNWLYIQEPGVKLGRIQLFNNWSPDLVADRGLLWLGLEYFCQEGDEFWSLDDEALTAFALGELEQLGMAQHGQKRDARVVRVPKAYPAYFGSYDAFDTLRDYLDRIDNLYLIGRNGMHRYNNQDHSMLSARAAVRAIKGKGSKADIWQVNAEASYHEASPAGEDG